MSSDRYYAGIGSRETPKEVLALFRHLAFELAEMGMILRSGAADGADIAFEQGCDAAHGRKQIFLPWVGFNGRTPSTGKVFAGAGPHAMELASKFHPSWDRCGRGARALHARNGYQVLGPRLDRPIEFVACWTKGGTGAGGTGQAIRIARSRGIPVYDFGESRAIEDGIYNRVMAFAQR